MAYKDILRQRAKKNTLSKVVQMFSLYDVIKYPITSEKSINQSANLNAYHFAIDMRANKNDVKQAVMALYGITPLDVTTSRLPHKGRMNRKTVRKPFKKAIVVLKKWDSITIA